MELTELTEPYKCGVGEDAINRPRRLRQIFETWPTARNVAEKQMVMDAYFALHHHHVKECGWAVRLREPIPTATAEKT